MATTVVTRSRSPNTDLEINLSQQSTSSVSASESESGSGSGSSSDSSFTPISNNKDFTTLITPNPVDKKKKKLSKTNSPGEPDHEMFTKFSQISREIDSAVIDMQIDGDQDIGSGSGSGSGSGTDEHMMNDEHQVEQFHCSQMTTNTYENHLKNQINLQKQLLQQFNRTTIE
jgi:hypothetical protein